MFVHAVDLSGGMGFADLPLDFLIALVGEMVHNRNASPGQPVTVQASDVGITWEPGTSLRRWSTCGCRRWLPGSLEAPPLTFAPQTALPYRPLPAWL